FGPKLGYMTAMLHGEFDVENVDIELGFALDSDSASSFALPSEKVLAVRELPAVETMATVARYGTFVNNCRSYGALGGWLEHNGYTLAGVAREVFLQPPLPGREDEVVVEIQVPVEKALPVGSTPLASLPS
ncbi:MAG: hypothetical protein AAF560_33355, partial [Acidobacteriota bacterium]